MNFIETTGTNVTRDTDTTEGNPRLKVARDQRQDWAAIPHGDRLDFNAATAIVNATAANDGKRVDVSGIVLEDCKAIECPDTGALALQRNSGRMVLRDHAFGQLATAIHAPAPYLRSLPSGLAIDCLNAGLQEYGGNTRTFRCADMREHGGGIEARAMVSPRFAALDDRPVLQHLGDALDGMGLLDDLRVRALAVGEITVLRCTLATVDMPDGHPIEWGFDLRNGELGNASISLSTSIYRLVCTNGMRAWTEGQKTAWRHVGSPNKLFHGFRAALPQAIEHGKRVAQLCAGTTDRVIPISEIRDMYKKLDLTKSQIQEAERQARIEAGHTSEGASDTANGDERLSLWDAINGVTASARGLGHQARLDVEDQAGILLARAAA